MSFGAAGTIQHMITTLRNNKMLLRVRSGFFRRELSYSELRQIYKDSSTPIHSKRLSKEEKRVIRKRIKAQQSKLMVKSYILFFAISSILFGTGFYCLKNYRLVNKRIIHAEKEPLLILYTTNYFNNLEEGNRLFKEKEFFFALGKYEKALRIRPNDSIAEMKIAYCYFKLCQLKGTACYEGKEFAEELLEKSSKNERMLKLRTYFITKLNHKD